MPKLSDMKYDFFPIREIEPKGWLLNQLRIQAAGLGGKLDLFWPDVAQSKWTGGDAESWERLPYWLDGFVPLAFLLRDEGMIARARKAVDGIVSRQEADGWLCPCDESERYRYDVWALFLVLKALVVWQGASGDERIEGVVERALQSLDRHIDRFVLFNWAQTRWFEALIPIYWLYGRTGEGWLLNLAVKLRAQGFDWAAFYENWPLALPLERGRWSQMNHVVNQGMMLKSGPLYARISGLKRDWEAAAGMFRQLDASHGTVTGIFTGDECLAGQSPAQGTELCAVVEAMYSLEWLLALTGDAAFGDRLERIAFNALPATFSPDMETHQYVQQVNQAECSLQGEPVFLTNGPDANLFGVEPHFGCCTANFHQGWPKLAASAFMRSPGSVAVALLLPAALHTQINGVPVRVEVDTEYPFKGRAAIRVEAASPVPFELSVRIPGWAKGARLFLDGSEICVKPGGYAAINHTWCRNELKLELPMRAAVEPRPNGLIAVTRGPLVYSLPIGEKWVKQNREGVEDMPWLNNYEVFPTTKWKYGLVLEDPERDIAFEEMPVGVLPFSPGGAPVLAKAKGRQVPWEMIRGAAAPKPAGPACGPVEELTLIPYGCTNLRMTELPVVPKE